MATKEVNKDSEACVLQKGKGVIPSSGSCSLVVCLTGEDLTSFHCMGDSVRGINSVNYGSCYAIATSNEKLVVLSVSPGTSSCILYV